MREYIWICDVTTSKSKEKCSCQDLSGLSPLVKMMIEQIRYRALVYAWLKYARLPEMAGVGLQKQTFVAAGEGEYLLYLVI